MAWRAIASPKSSPPKSTGDLPPVPNVLSSAPLAFRRATWMLPPSGPKKPASRILPLGSTSTDVAWLNPPQLKSFLPSPEKVVSREPLGFRRATATCRSERPASTILPSGCSAAPSRDPLSPPKSIVRLPPDPNVVSNAPLARRRATQKVPGAAPSPATTILPLGCTSTAFAASVPPKLIVFFPLPSKLVSRSPGAAMHRPYRRAGANPGFQAAQRSASLPSAMRKITMAASSTG